MTRLLIILLTIGTSVYGQDTSFVLETCNKIKQLKDKNDIEGQLNIVYEQSLKQVPKIAQESKSAKGVYAFQYKFNRELKRTCPEFKLERTKIRGQKIIDIEDKFNKNELDSLKKILNSIATTKDIYVFIVTIDDYFPFNSIEQFSSNTREYWGNGNNFKKGNVIIAISTTNKAIRISTSDISMKYLTDTECSDTINLMLPYFKKDELFNGVVNGLNDLKRKI